MTIDSIREFRELTEIKIQSKGSGLFMIGGGVPKNFIQDTVICAELLKRSMKLTVSNAGVRSVDKKGSFDEFLKTVKNKNLSPRLKKLKKSLLIKSPFQKKPVQSKTA